MPREVFYDNNEYLADGKTPNPNYGTSWEVVTPDPVIEPNNPGNPYFGKTPKIVSAFWGHLLKTYIAIAPGNTLAEKQAAGADRYARLRNSLRAQAVADVINNNDTIDPDDKNGDFLSFMNFLITTDHENGSGKLMTESEKDSIMDSWV